MDAPTASVIVAAIGAVFGALASFMSSRNSRRLAEIAEIADQLEIARHVERLEGREEIRQQLLAAAPDVVVPVPVAAFVAVPEAQK